MQSDDIELPVWGKDFSIQRRFRTARGIVHGVNSGLCDLAYLRSNSIYANSYDEDRFRSILAAASRSGSRVLFHTHDVRENPGPWGCLPRQLERVFRLAIEYDFEILPVKNALARIFTHTAFD